MPRGRGEMSGELLLEQRRLICAILMQGIWHYRHVSRVISRDFSWIEECPLPRFEVGGTSQLVSLLPDFCMSDIHYRVAWDSIPKEMSTTQNHRKTSVLGLQQGR